MLEPSHCSHGLGEQQRLRAVFRVLAKRRRTHYSFGSCSQPEAVDVVPTMVGPEDNGTPFRPWWTIWTAPRQTIRRIVGRNAGYGVVTLLCLNGINQALDRASRRNAGDTIGLPAVIGIAVVLGPIGGLFSGWIFSHLVTAAGRWIGGKADRRRVLAAIAWAVVPSIAGLALWVVQLAVAGSDVFTAATPRLDASPLAALVLLAVFIGGVVLAVWSFVLMCNTLAEVQGFRSAWAGFANLLLACLLFVVALAAVAAVVIGATMLLKS